MRVDDWDLRLYEAIQRWQQREFAWGTYDCVAFAGACVEAITGRNPAREWFGLYDTLLGAARILEEKALPDRLTALFGEPVPVAMAQRGDLVYAEDPEEGPQLGVCVGQVTLSWAEDGTLAEYPTLAMQKAWHVQ